MRASPQRGRATYGSGVLNIFSTESTVRASPQRRGRATYGSGVFLLLRVPGAALALGHGVGLQFVVHPVRQLHVHPLPVAALKLGRKLTNKDTV